MKSPAKLIITGLMFVCCLGLTATSFAAVNSAIDGGGAFGLADSGTVTINPLAQPTLMKAVFDASGNCVASSVADASCNNVTTADAPSGSTLTFVIYVENPAASSIDLTDIRFNDNLVGFTYVAGSISYGTLVATGADWTTVYGAAVPGTPGDDAADVGDPVSYTAPQVSAGGPGGAGNNETITVTPDQIFAIAFDVTFP